MTAVESGVVALVVAGVLDKLTGPEVLSFCLVAEFCVKLNLLLLGLFVVVVVVAVSSLLGDDDVVVVVVIIVVVVGCEVVELLSVGRPNLFVDNNVVVFGSVVVVVCLAPSLDIDPELVVLLCVESFVTSIMTSSA